MGKRFLKMILMGIMSLCIFSSAHAALSWPDNLELDPSVLEQGSVGDILGEISLHLVESWDLHNPPNNGLVSLAIENHQGVYNQNQGVFSVTTDHSIGIAFIGTITFHYGSGSYTATKETWNTALYPHTSGWTPAEALIRAKGTKDGSSHSVSLSGKIVFVRLKSGPITTSEIKYPKLVIEYRASGKGPGDTYIELFVSNATSGSITIPRTCSVLVSGVNIDFGNIKDVVPSQSTPLSQGSSSVSVQCAGVSNQTTLVNMSVSSSSGHITGDPSSIPMSNFINSNNDLVVKGTLGSTVPNCLSTEVLSPSDNNIDSKWLNVTNGTTYTIMTFAPSSSASNVTQNKTVNWYLCRRSWTQPLPIAKYTASAVLSITFN